MNVRLCGASQPCIPALPPEYRGSRPRLRRVAAKRPIIRPQRVAPRNHPSTFSAFAPAAPITARPAYRFRLLSRQDGFRNFKAIKDEYASQWDTQSHILDDRLSFTCTSTVCYRPALYPAFYGYSPQPRVHFCHGCNAPVLTGSGASWMDYSLPSGRIAIYSLPLTGPLRPAFGSDHPCKGLPRFIPRFITLAYPSGSPGTTRIQLRNYHAACLLSPKPTHIIAGPVSGTSPARPCPSCRNRLFIRPSAAIRRRLG